MYKMNGQACRNLNSLFNALSAMALTIVNGLLTIVVTRFILESFGSDFNGLNSTANQIVNVLLILEGGFTMASNVALFAPLTKQDYSLVNGLLSATRNKFRKIGLIFLAVGVFVSAIYAVVANSNLPREFIATVIIMTVVPAAFNLYYASVYRVLLQTQQKEYIISLITLFTVALGHIANIVMICFDGPMWMVRFNTMVFALLNSLLIAGYVKRKNPFIDFTAAPCTEAIKGTRDVMIQKIVGVIYNSAPIVFLSVSPTGGTLLASVYAVYNNVFIMLKSLLHAVIDAPRLGFGQMLTERKKEEVCPVFAQYEYIAFFAVFVMLTTCCALILPFVQLYTVGINDINYYDVTIAILMVMITVMEMIHIPSGHLINMAGEFRVSRNIQLVACIVLIVSMSIGGILWGVYGMLFAVLLCAVLLSVLEMGYIHLCFFKGTLLRLMKILLPLVCCGVLVCWFEMNLNIQINGYLSFCLYGIILLIINTIIAMIIGVLFSRVELFAVMNRAKNLLSRLV